MFRAHNRKNTYAFSIIELMVVIAVIAVLSAIAIPAYKRYLIASRIDSVMQVIDGLVEKAIIYSNTNGNFGNATKLGLNTAYTQKEVGLADRAHAAALSPYFTGIVPGYGF